MALFCPAVLLAQGVGKPEITSIPGGFFVKWASPVDVSAVRLDKGLTGVFEMMFDMPSVGFLAEVLDRKAPSVPNPDMVTALADYWIVRGKPDRAIPLYEASLKQGNLDEVKTIIFQNNLAMLYSQVLKQHDKALGIVNSALEAKKDSVTLLDTKGLILMNSGKPEEAVPPLTRAVELSCQLPVYCMHLATALLQVGRTDQARRWFDNVRPQLTELSPSMTKENKEMFDNLQRALPPVNE
jgi:tetratricopeptide (TPR) repeat protein